MTFDPPADCPLCPRLVAFREAWRDAEPDWHNAPVDTFAPEAGDDEVRLLIVGMAPGLRGANRTGRPFTGDFAGDLLYATLEKFDLSEGRYDARPDDKLSLKYCAITNAVRCVPPENKPVSSEVNQCRPFLLATLNRFADLKVIITLGKLAHDSTVRTLGEKVAQHPFGHGAESRSGHLTILASYHCSRYNTNTGRLTPKMFESVFARAGHLIHD